MMAATHGWVRVEREVRCWDLLIYEKEIVELLAQYLERSGVEVLGRCLCLNEMARWWRDHLDVGIGNGNRVAEPR
jgi:hypothetical protein